MQRSAASIIAQSLRKLVPAIHGSNGRLIAFAALVILLVVGSALAWQRWGSGVLGSSQFMLTAEKLEITPQPDWIDPKSNIKAEVFRDASLHKTNLLDAQAAIQIARAFELHTWVSRVVRVQKKAAGRVSIDLEYRRPVALVEVLFNNVLSYEPIDVHGVVLPEDLFHRDQKNLDKYLRVTADYSMPSGPVGTAWGDERITGAAGIAAMIEKGWQKWNLYRILAHPVDPTSGKCSFELLSTGSSRILWGHAPGQESTNEPSSLQKITWLAELIQREGPLDTKDTRARDIDLRQSSGIVVTPHSSRPSVTTMNSKQIH